MPCARWLGLRPIACLAGQERLYCGGCDDDGVAIRVGNVLPPFYSGHSGRSAGEFFGQDDRVELFGFLHADYDLHAHV